MARIKMFDYTDSKQKKTSRTVLVLSETTDKISGIDISDMDNFSLKTILNGVDLQNGHFRTFVKDRIDDPTVHSNDKEIAKKEIKTITVRLKEIKKHIYNNDNDLIDTILSMVNNLQETLE